MKRAAPRIVFKIVICKPFILSKYNLNIIEGKP
jgi:hypothetical protein